MFFCKETEAIRPPLKPLNSEEFRQMIYDADVIATGIVTRVNQSKNLGARLETVIIHVMLAPERILKGDKLMKNIAIEETYQQYPTVGIHGSAGNVMAARIAGPSPQVGRYIDGERVLVFLKSVNGLDQYCPLGSGNHDAYFGVFQISSAGVKSDRYLFNEVMSGYSKSETDFLDFIISILGE